MVLSNKVFSVFYPTLPCQGIWVLIRSKHVQISLSLPVGHLRSLAINQEYFNFGSVKITNAIPSQRSATATSNMESKLEKANKSFNTLEEIKEEEKKLQAQLLEAVELMRAAELQCVIQKSKLDDLKQSKQRLEREIKTSEKHICQVKSAAGSHLDSLKSEMGIFNHVIDESGYLLTSAADFV